MRDRFFQFYPLEENTIKELWDNSTFIFDTNVLLNLYRYSTETSEEFLETISKLKDRLWMPFQVGLEFHKNRMSAIEAEITNYKEFQKKIDTIHADLENKNRNPFLSLQLSDAFSDLRLKVNEEMQVKISELQIKYANDNILQRLNNIFADCVGVELSTEKLNSIYKDGEVRFKEDVPPGYEDKKKPPPDRYGDLIIWNEIMDRSIQSKKPVIFITDDGKEDWWLIHGGKTISQRPELSKEFKIKTGLNCHFYKPFQFLKYSNTFLGSKIKSEIIKEVKHLESPINLIHGVIIIALKVRCLRGKADLQALTDAILRDGYQITIEENEVEDIFSLKITLPHIADLERRFRKKFLMNLENFHIDLVEQSKQLRV